MIAIDSYHFGKIVVAPLNIVFYNVFSTNGPDLYGTEPAYFYLFNLFLNFNLVLLFALVAGPLFVSLLFPNRVVCLIILFYS